MEGACEICLTDFTKTDKMWSPLCGHFYHDICMKDWISNYTPKCPECHETEKKQIIELEKKLDSRVEEICILRASLQQSKNNFLCLQIVNSITNTENHSLSTQLRESAMKMMKLQWECFQLKDEKRILQSQLEESFKQNMELVMRSNQNHSNFNTLTSSHSKSYYNYTKYRAEIMLLSFEKENLNLELNVLRKTVISLKEDNKILEQKLKCVAVRLEEEIRNSLFTSCEQVKLESCQERNNQKPTCEPTEDGGDRNERFESVKRNIYQDEISANQNQILNESKLLKDIPNEKVNLQSSKEKGIFTQQQNDESSKRCNIYKRNRRRPRKPKAKKDFSDKQQETKHGNRSQTSKERKQLKEISIEKANPKSSTGKNNSEKQQERNLVGRNQTSKENTQLKDKIFDGIKFKTTSNSVKNLLKEQVNLNCSTGKDGVNRQLISGTTRKKYCRRIRNTTGTSKLSNSNVTPK